MSDVDPERTSDFNLKRFVWIFTLSDPYQMGQQLGQGGIVHPEEDRLFTTMELKRLQGLLG